MSQQRPRISVVIPALDESASIGRVLADVPAWVSEVIVADNGSTDGTPEAARAAGARVVAEPRRGYGSACLAALDVVDRPDIVVFLDADYSDHPDEMDRLVDPIAHGDADLVIGSRVLGRRQRGALSPHQRWGNALACCLIRLFWRQRFTDLGPFRAVRCSALQRLNMDDPDWGWTAQMQARAARLGLLCAEVPVSYRKRVGRSKISGTVRGVAAAGYKILRTIIGEAIGARLSFGAWGVAKCEGAGLGSGVWGLERARTLNPRPQTPDPKPALRTSDFAATSPAVPSLVSVIIPTLNEERGLGATLEAAAREPGVQVIVVDGGSSDSTVSIARGYGVKVIETSRGRARQMNAGATAARGDALLFLHADTRPPANFGRYVRRGLSDPSVAAGAFEFRTDAPGPLMRLVERLANWRSRHLFMPYGDQAIFLRADTFRRLGGFADLPLLEDHELMRRLRRLGRVWIAPVAAVTSARRFRDHGAVVTSLIHRAIVLAHTLGVPPATLARWRR